MEAESSLTGGPRDETLGLPASEVEIRPVVDGQRRAVLRPLKAVGDRCIDRVPIAQRIVEAEVVEQSQPVDIQSRPVCEVVLFTSNARAWDEVGPEKPTWEGSYVEVEIVDLILTPRVSEDVQSHEAECGVMLLAVNTHVDALHEPVVYRGKELGFRSCRGVCPHAGAEQVHPADNALEVGYGRRFSGCAQKLYVEGRPREYGLGNRFWVDHSLRRHD